MKISNLNEYFSVSDQLRPEDMAALAGMGIKTVVNNRPDNESADQPTSEQLAAAAKASGISYHHIPVVPGNLTADAVQRFRQVVDNADGPILAFCRSGQRSAGLFQASAFGAKTDEEPLNFLQIVGSTLAAAIGVQSRKKMERDLTRGELVQFVIAGVIFTVLFVAGMITFVSYVAQA
ncbi:MAG: TIGR01244 family phosphatase [Pseudomonadales bacterium]|nr:TIGR01244 family phosphatase [Pseudomonadales bacterium]